MAKLKNIMLTLFFLAVTVISFAQNQLLKNFLTVEEGLSHNEVTSIVQDNDGFIWIGTRGGLNRYDGYQFKIFNQVPGDSNSLVNPSVESLFVDRSGNIWIGSKSGGVSKYNPVTGVFKNIANNYNQPNEILPDNRVLCFHEDKKGRIWMGTWENGIIVYDEKSNTSEHYLGNILVNSITETPDGNIWVGANALYEYLEDENEFFLRRRGQVQEIKYDQRENVFWLVGGNNSGLVRFDLRNNKDERFKIEDSLPNVNTVHTYESLYIDSQHRIWIGTWGTGFYSFNPNKKTFERYLVYPDNRQTINKDYDAVLDIFEDKDHNLWLGTNGGGVYVLTPQLKFNSIGYHPEPGKGLINTRIMSVVDDRSGNLWMGTIGSGLFWSPDRENVYPVENPLDNKKRFFTIKYLYEDLDGKIWAGTNVTAFTIEFVNGIPKMKRIRDKYNNPTFSDQAVSFLNTDNLLWYGTLQHGLFIFDKSNDYKQLKRIVKQDSASGGLRSDRISYLLNDSKGRIWVGTYNGLHVVNKKDTTVHLAESVFHIEGEFTGNIVTCLEEDVKGNIWIGTPNGLNRLSEPAENNFKVDYFTEKDGLASNFIKGIAHGLNGNIWVSTNVGISKLILNEPVTRVINFNESDGVKGKNFTEASVFRNSKGEIFFGGSQGLTYFNPEEIRERDITHKPIFTALYVLNQVVNAGKESDSKQILKKSITHTDEFTLSYKQNNFEIEFSALDFQSIGRNQYKYLLEGLDLDYNFIGNRHFINFNNLKPGEYTLKVISSNSHNVWNEEPAEIKIHITPPFWQSWYALAFYIFVVIAIVTIIRWNAVKQVRLANSLEIEKLQHEQDQKMNEMKLRFFTNISHEFRTPLTLILAPLKELIRKKEDFHLDEEVSSKIILIQNNAQRLMKLVNQLLDFRKAETGNMKLSAGLTNIEDFTSEVCYSFEELAKINNIEFRFSSSLKTKQIWFDCDKLEIVLNNLISNSFKFVQGKGKIDVALYEEEDEVLISISDNGPGIAPTEIKHIFERFYRVNNKDNISSTGIGLDLAKRFTEMHGGNITVTSEPNVLTEFIVALPKGNKHLQPGEIMEVEATTNKNIRKESILNSVIPLRQKHTVKSGECILIVEDEPELNSYLVNLLEPQYRVESALNGSDGFEKAVAILPDLIISDVVMPGLDGFEFCKKVRNNEKTPTIPFIFLTAKHDEQFRLLATQSGADDFISKPFDPGLLLEKVKNILTNRKKLQKQYSKSIRLEPSDIEITSSEEIFIEKAISIIEKNLQNPKFSSEYLASELNMSNSSLYRKLKGLTNSSTAEFIRSIRIKRAAQLLSDKEKTITEIAYEVGFNDVKHFRTVFQKHFGCSPSEYREKL